MLMEPKDYAIRRVLLTIPTLLFVSVLTFALSRISGSPVALYASRYASQETIERIKDLYHLNEPIWVQYLYWLKGVLSGDLGWSVTSGSSVIHALAVKVPATLELALAGVVVALVISFTLGTLAGRYQDTWIDHFMRALAVSGRSTPQFWSALLLVYIFYVQFNLFPLGRATTSVWRSIAHPTGFYTIDAILALSPTAFGDAIWHLALPAVVLGYTNAAVIMRHLRSEMVEKKKEEYVNAARARGVSNRTVYRRHIRRNALIPTLTVAGLSLAFLVRGAILVEIVFGWPGLGRWIANAALQGDFASMMGFILVVAIMVIAVNLTVDVLYSYLDPRIELGD